MTNISLDSLISAAKPETYTDRFALGKHLQNLGKSLCDEAEAATKTEFTLNGGEPIQTMYGKLNIRKTKVYEFEDEAHKELEKSVEDKNYEIKALKARLKDIEKRLIASEQAKLLQVKEALVLSNK